MSGALAGTGSEVLEDVRNDARRSAENSARQSIGKQFPYSGSLYGLPGQTRSSSIRESAIRSALSGLFGSCKKSGAIDISRGGLNMDVTDILANTEIKVPEVNTSVSARGGLLGSVSSLIPKPTEILGDKVKVGGNWVPAKDYNASVAETKAELVRQQQAAARAIGSKPAPGTKPRPQGQSQQPPATPAVSKIWSADK
jgi:hypothetical protein